MAKLKINIIAIHRIASFSPELEIINDYAKRIPWPINFHQLEIKGKYPPEKQKDLEGEMLLKSIPSDNFVISLDEKGAQLSSKEFCHLLEKQIKPISFIIGGACGLSEKVKDHSNFLLSLSKMTFPHIIARVLLVEQLYRAYSITKNHPYHK